MATEMEDSCALGVHCSEEQIDKTMETQCDNHYDSGWTGSHIEEPPALYSEGQLGVLEEVTPEVEVGKQQE